MRIITLVENTKSVDSILQERFGLGFYIEVDGKKILFDNGPDNAFEVNAAALGIDIADIDAFILSHAHYDHGAGLRDFFRLNNNAQVYLLDEAAGSYYSMAKGPLRYIGISHTLFKEHAHRFHFFSDTLRLFDHIQLMRVSESIEEKPLSNSLLLKEVDGVYQPDDFKHELVMSVIHQQRQVVFTGCAHNGIINMLETVRKANPQLPISTVIGGFHLMNTATGGLGEDPEVVLDLGHKLASMHIDKIYTGHCTGNDAFDILKTVLGDTLEKLFTGMEINNE